MNELNFSDNIVKLRHKKKDNTRTISRFYWRDKSVCFKMGK